MEGCWSWGSYLEAECYCDGFLGPVECNEEADGRTHLIRMDADVELDPGGSDLASSRVGEVEDMPEAMGSRGIAASESPVPQVELDPEIACRKRCPELQGLDAALEAEIQPGPPSAPAPVPR